MKPNYYFYDDAGKFYIHVDHMTGKVTATENGYDFSEPISNDFWDEFKPMIPIEPEVTPALKQDYERYQDSFGDNVNHPSHYGQGNIEAIEYIKDFLTPEEWQGYLRGNIAKYLHRWPYKNGREDLKKAEWYLNRLIETTQEDN